MKLFIVILSTMWCLGFAHAQSPENLRDSLSKATETLAYHPDSIDLRLKKVSWNIQIQQWQYAKDDLDKVLFLQPSNVAGLYYRAYVNERLNRYKFARLDYENLLQIVPGNFEAQLGLALLNQKDKHFTEALDQINILVQMNPDSAIAYAARGGIEVERKMYDLAEYDYAKAHELDSANTDYLYNLVEVSIQLKHKESALAALDNLQHIGVPRPKLNYYYRKLAD